MPETSCLKLSALASVVCAHLLHCTWSDEATKFLLVETVHVGVGGLLRTRDVLKGVNSRLPAFNRVGPHPPSCNPDKLIGFSNLGFAGILASVWETSRKAFQKGDFDPELAFPF